MKNQLVLITGGSSGIGFALAKRYAHLGANVWILARRQDQLDIALEVIRSFAISPDQSFGSLQSDVSNTSQTRAQLEKFAVEVGIPDVLVNSAGVVHPGRFEGLDDEKIHWMMDINYFGAVNVIKPLIVPMIERRSGHIINIGSGASFVGIYGYSAYSASKYAIRGFSDVLRMELKPFNVQVHVVFPPDTDTPQLEYESHYKPAITKEISGIVKPLSPDLVAERVIKGVDHGRYVIIPDFQTRFLYGLINLAGNKTYKIMDFLLSGAIKKHGFPHPDLPGHKGQDPQ